MGTKVLETPWKGHRAALEFTVPETPDGPPCVVSCRGLGRGSSPWRRDELLDTTVAQQLGPRDPPRPGAAEREGQGNAVLLDLEHDDGVDRLVSTLDEGSTDLHHGVPSRTARPLSDVLNRLDSCNPA